jgi:hypothetical protein
MSGEVERFVDISEAALRRMDASLVGRTVLTGKEATIRPEGTPLGAFLRAALVISLVRNDMKEVAALVIEPEDLGGARIEIPLEFVLGIREE